MAKTKILYIDDEDVNLRIFNINLSGKYDVITSNSGRDGLKLLSESEDVNIVVTDVRMPYMSGIEFIERATKIRPGITFFILSGHNMSEEIESLIELGIVKKHFRKPFNLREIGTEIELALKE